MLRMAHSIIVGVVLMVVSTAAWAQSAYRVQSGDRLSIEVLEDASLNRVVVVLPDGRFSFPFAGPLRGAGRTVSQIESSIVTAISNQFQEAPSVFVSVLPAERFEQPQPEPEPETINIFFVGEVNEPGVRAVEPGTSFLQAIAQSGGLTQFAATKRLQLRRTNDSGQQSLVTINYRALSRGAQLEQDVIMVDGDVILVPERRLFE